MSIIRGRSKDKLPQIIEWTGLRRPGSHQQLGDMCTIKTEGRTSAVRTEGRASYNPLKDPHLQIYLGKSHLKSKLQQMGYVLNPQNTGIVRRSVSKRKDLPQLLATKEGTRKERGKSKKRVIETVSKLEFDNYVKRMREKIGSS